jgi:hypothetical protein
MLMRGFQSTFIVLEIIIILYTITKFDFLISYPIIPLNFLDY